MGNTQDITIKTYNENFNEYCSLIFNVDESEYIGWINKFIELVPKNGKVLEIGSASGRDARFLREKGLDVICTDVIDEALSNLEKDQFQVMKYDFRNEIYTEWKNDFDGIFANAVLLHATQDVFESFINKSLDILKEKGIFAFSLQIGEGEEFKYNKFNAPRFFKYYSEKDLLGILNKFPYEIVYKNIANNKWLQIILRKHE